MPGLRGVLARRCPMQPMLYAARRRLRRLYSASAQFSREGGRQCGAFVDHSSLPWEAPCAAAGQANGLAGSLPAISCPQLHQRARAANPAEWAASAWRQASSRWRGASHNLSTRRISDTSNSEFAETVANTRDKLVPVPPDLAGKLAPLAAQCRLRGREAELARAVARLGQPRQQGIAAHGAAVAAYLAGLGIEQGQLGRLLLRCLLLFSRPVEQRAGVLFGQLMALGLTGAQAARCFEQQPTAANSPSFASAIAVLAPLLAAGCRAGDVGKTGEQLLGELLVGQPSAVEGLHHRQQLLQQRIDGLLQLGLSKQQLVAALRGNVSLLRPPEHLAALEAVLREEVGTDREAWCKVLRHAPMVGRLSEDRLRQYAQALVSEFGGNGAARVVGVNSAIVTVRTTVWQRCLAVLSLHGVADPRAVAMKCPAVLSYDWLRPSIQANLLALHRYLPWQPSAAKVIERFANYVSGYPAERLAGRLLFLEQAGLLPRLVADKREVLNKWRQERGLPVNRKAAGEPWLISIRDVAVLSDAALEQQLAELGIDRDSWLAFRAGLEQVPAWQQLMADAEAEAARLQRLLPPELAQT